MEHLKKGVHNNEEVSIFIVDEAHDNKPETVVRT
jgi:hypothetical protein